MFDRSRYNWATTQVETSCKFDFAATDDAIEFIKSFLAQDDLFDMTNAKRKSGGVDWYNALAAVMFSLRDNDEVGELPEAQRRLYALIFAACAAKAGAGGSSPSAALANSYEQFGLDRSEIG